MGWMRGRPSEGGWLSPSAWGQECWEEGWDAQGLRTKQGAKRSAELRGSARAGAVTRSDRPCLSPSLPPPGPGPGPGPPFPEGQSFKRGWCMMSDDEGFRGASRVVSVSRYPPPRCFFTDNVRFAVERRGDLPPREKWVKKLGLKGNPGTFFKNSS